MQKNSRSVSEFKKQYTIAQWVIVFGIVILLIWLNHPAKAVLVAVVAPIYFYFTRPKESEIKEIILEQEANRAQFESFSPYLKYLAMLLAVMIPISVVVYLVTNDASLIFWIDVTVAIVALLGIFFGVGLRERKRLEKEKNERTAFVEQLGFSLQSTADPSSLHELFGNIGEHLAITDVLSGKIERYPVRIFNLFYKWMKNASNSVLMVEITNTRMSPAMLILSKEDDFGGTIVPSRIFTGVLDQLEGDFNKHFTVFLEQRSQDEVRQFLTPDIMAILIDEMSAFNFLFFGDKLYIVLPSSQYAFLKNHFVEQIKKTELIVGKWSLTLSKIGS